MNSDFDELSHLELQSTYQMKALIGSILTSLSVHFGGDVTVNQMRIGHYIGQQSLYNGTATSNKDISAQLGIPRSTVSRIVADFVQKKWVIEVPHPDDGRRKLLQISPDHPDADTFEMAFRDLINKLLLRYDQESIVVVDTKQQGF
jgi:DNA-binding MarR family transcriptional regulator